MFFWKHLGGEGKKRKPKISASYFGLSAGGPLKEMPESGREEGGEGEGSGLGDRWED